MFAADSKFDVAQSSFCFFIHFKPISKFSPIMLVPNFSPENLAPHKKESFV